MSLLPNGTYWDSSWTWLRLCYRIWRRGRLTSHTKERGHVVWVIEEIAGEGT